MLCLSLTVTGQKVLTFSTLKKSKCKILETKTVSYIARKDTEPHSDFYTWHKLF